MNLTGTEKYASLPPFAAFLRILRCPNGMKGSPVRRVFFAFLIALGSTVTAGAQQPSADTNDNQPAELKQIYDPAEYTAYMTALNTADLAGRMAALNAFLERFPNSVMRDRVEDLYMDTLMRLDNQRTAPLRQQLLFRRARGEAFARNLARNPDNLSLYTRCGLGQFTIEESSERDRPLTRTVPTANGDQEVEVLHGITLHIADGGIPFVNFKAEKLGNAYVESKKALLDSLQQYMSDEPDMVASKPWPSTMTVFEVYGINRKQLNGTVLGIYLLFHDADSTVVTLYLLNPPPETPKVRTLHEYRVLRDQFLRTYTTCTGELLPGPH
jgi:hypothetical protein